MEEQLIIPKSIDEVLTKEEERKKKNQLIVNSLTKEGLDPYENQSFFSSQLFTWAFHIIRLANLTPLKQKHLGHLKGERSSHNYMNNIYYVYNTLNYKSKRRCSLTKTVLRANWQPIVVVFILSLVTTLMSIGSINLFRLYIQAFTVGPIVGYDHVYIGVGYLLIKFFEMFFKRRSNEIQNYIGFKAGGELNCMIYDKILKASPASMKNKAQSGEIINYIQVDSFKMIYTLLNSPYTISIPILLVTYIYMLFDFLGWSFCIGLAVLIVFLAFNFIVQKWYKKYQTMFQKNLDKRLLCTNETFFNLKVLKLYAWDVFFLLRTLNARDQELITLRSIFNITNLNRTLLWFSPVATAIASIGAYHFFSDVVRIEDIFTCLGILSSIQEPIRSVASIYTSIIEMLISMQRIEQYLDEEEFNFNGITYNDKALIDQGVFIQIRNGNFSWGINKLSQEEETIKASNSDKDKNSKPNNKEEIKVVIKEEDPKAKSKNDDGSEIPKSILQDINLSIRKGEFICIIGEVGSGKSSLLQAILNNMIKLNNECQVTVNGSISYVSQMAWIQNATVQKNILFFKELDPDFYEKVIEISELKPDLEILVGKDQTEIGEKGINLSGGQKARISIARALYADNDIYLFDDPISALDAHVGMAIMKNCICDYLKHKTRILVTHALQYTAYADRIIYMKEGRIAWEGRYDDLCHQTFYQSFYQSMKQSEEEKSKRKKSLEKDENISLVNDSSLIKNKTKEVKRITKDEDKEEGKVDSKVFRTYVSMLGGTKIVIELTIVLILWQVLRAGSDIWLAYWNEMMNSSDESTTYYFSIYAALGIGGTFFTFLRLIICSNGSLKMSDALHETMITKLVNAPINLFHDTVPKGIILNRLSKDLNVVDVYTMYMFSSILAFGTTFVGSIAVCGIYQPYSLIFLPFLTVAGYYVLKYYMNCSRELSRLEGVIRSPMLNILNETIGGSETIRSFNYQSNYVNKFRNQIDEYLNIVLYNNGTRQWFCLMLDILSFLFICFLLIYTMLDSQSFTPQVIGILLTYSIQLQYVLTDFLICRSNLESNMVSMERCLTYTKLDTEKPQVMENDTLIPQWPSQGKIQFKNYTVRYRPDTEIVLKNLSFDIMPGSKIGIAGRTGSGKSTIALSLFRILEPLTGSIWIDDVDISTIGLNKLRNGLTIIPQDPSLMEGTLKYNIDPIGLYSNEEIESVMKQIGFWYICETNDKKLELPVTEGGLNLSVGEKQLICITRAILRKSKIVVMDEATASIDFTTEEIIQKAINELLSQSTLITIAHRIKTIVNSTKILVLSNGEIVEYDTPQNLLQRKTSTFYELYHNSVV